MKHLILLFFPVLFFGQNINPPKDYNNTVVFKANHKSIKYTEYSYTEKNTITIKYGLNDDCDTILLNDKMHYVLFSNDGSVEDLTTGAKEYYTDFVYVKDKNKGRVLSNTTKSNRRIEVYFTDSSRKKIISFYFIDNNTITIYFNTK